MRQQPHLPHHCPPPPPASRLDPAIVVWPAGRRLVWSYDAAWGSRQLFSGAPGRPGRFHPFSPGRSTRPLDVLYAASDLHGALSETVFHDIPVRGVKRIPQGLLVHRLAIDLEPVRDLHLVDLTSSGLSRLGVARTELVESGPLAYPATARWAKALHDSAAAPDGLQWVSRQHDTSTAVVLFGDRVTVDDLRLAGDTAPLVLYTGRGFEQVAQIADDEGITIIED